MLKDKKVMAHGIFFPSSVEHIIDSFSDHLPGKKFLDLGSGDGKVVELALAYTEKARGVEINQSLYDNSKVKNFITFGNMFSIDFSAEEVLYYYLKGSNHELELIQKLNKEFHGTLIIYYATMKEKQVEVFASFLNAKEIQSYPHVRVFSF